MEFPYLFMVMVIQLRTYNQCDVKNIPNAKQVLYNNSFSVQMTMMLQITNYLKYVRHFTVKKLESCLEPDAAFA